MVGGGCIDAATAATAWLCEDWVVTLSASTDRRVAVALWLPAPIVLLRAAVVVWVISTASDDRGDGDAEVIGPAAVRCHGPMSALEWDDAARFGGSVRDVVACCGCCRFVVTAAPPLSSAKDHPAEVVPEEERI